MELIDAIGTPSATILSAFINASVKQVMVATDFHVKVFLLCLYVKRVKHQ